MGVCTLGWFFGRVQMHCRLISTSSRPLQVSAFCFFPSLVCLKVLNCISIFKVTSNKLDKRYTQNACRFVFPNGFESEIIVALCTSFVKSTTIMLVDWLLYCRFPKRCQSC